MRKVVEIKFEEFDVDEVQHVEESCIGKAQCVLENVNNFKRVVESRLGDIKHDESNNYTVQCEMNSNIDNVS